jgi:hypothetical protein
MAARHGRWLVAVALGLTLGPACRWIRSASKGPPSAPPQDVEMDPDALQKFRHEITEYLDLHSELVERVPRVTEKSTPEEIAAHRVKMSEAIRAERHHEAQGAIFAPKVARAFRSVLQRDLEGPEGPAMLRELRAGNPKVEGTPRRRDPTQEVKRPVTLAVNAVYPAEAPVSSVPPSLLLHLPPLPEQVQYGFVGRALILRDSEAEVILDYIPDVVPDARLPR